MGDTKESHIRSRKDEPCYMNMYERDAFQEFYDEFWGTINIELLAFALLENNHIDNYFYKNLVNVCKEKDGKTAREALLKGLLNMCRLEHIIRALYESQSESLARKLHKYVQERNHLTVVNRTVVKRKRIHTYFKDLKRIVHNGKLSNIGGILRKIAITLEKKMRSENDPYQKQIWTDMYIAHLGVEIDALAITFDKDLPNHAIFDDLKSVTEEGTDTAISRVVYFGRKANALAIADKLDEGEERVKEAHCCANFSGPCLEIANMIYIDVYFKLWKFEKYPSVDLQKALMFEGRKGLWALSEEEEDIRALWKRMFLLRMIFCLLGIGNRANIIENFEISDSCISEAEKLLEAIDLNGIETRREMFYWVAQARLCELKHELLQAAKLIEKAAALAQKGNFKEVTYINEYKTRLEIRGEYSRQPESYTYELAGNVPSLSSLSDYCHTDLEDPTTMLESANGTCNTGNIYKCNGLIPDNHDSADSGDFKTESLSWSIVVESLEDGDDSRAEFENLPVIIQTVETEEFVDEEINKVHVQRNEEKDDDGIPRLNDLKDDDHLNKYETCTLDSAESLGRSLLDE